MTQRNDGGAAHPSIEPNQDGTPYHYNPGMSLRDAMAIAAAGHIWAQFQNDGTAKEFPEWRQGVAVEAYRLADEMIAARERT
ncbi:hypothetical protein [Castellaniella caeni]|uniref:hypothetical protein n=1 Tax=Castellaniella caeni TaxID=266123 RepID=UPI000C9F44C3|nr:hypothetical protein [Castellaniella caeni]